VHYARNYALYKQRQIARRQIVKKLPKTVLVRRPQTIDLECCGTFKLEEGRTYHDDGTTVFDAYIADGIANGSFEEAKRRPDTITVSARDLLRS
jgi:hypothetical protein